MELVHSKYKDILVNEFNKLVKEHLMVQLA